jgi:PmbA protein
MNNGARGCLVRRLSEMESPEEIGKEAGRRAVRGLGARTVPYQEVPVVYSPSMAVGLLGKVVDALNGQSIFSGQSFLVDKLGTQIANKNLTLVDDPFIKGGLGSAPFGEEGLALQRRVLINEGRLETYFLNAEAGRKLKMVANGGSSTNLIVQAGTLTADAIIASVQSGLYLTSVSGMGADTATGRYSLGAGGIWIENGKLSFAVEGLTISSTLQDMLAGIDAVGNDLDFKRGARVAPTILIRKMKVGASK